MARAARIRRNMQKAHLRRHGYSMEALLAVARWRFGRDLRHRIKTGDQC